MTFVQRTARWVVAAAALGMMGVGAEFEKSRAPADPLGEARVTAFLAAVNAGTEAAVREFIQKNFAAQALQRMPVEPRLRRLMGFVGEAGPLELKKRLDPSPQGPGFVARSKKTGSWYEIRLELEPGPPRGIMGIDIEDSDASAMDPEPALKSDADVAKAADALLAGLAAKDRFSGAVLIAREGQPFLEKAYGLADRERGVANTTATQFNIGSINKTFTQVAIAQLALAGKLELSDTIRKHLPDYPNAVADEITILQLVNMSSGLGDFFDEGYDKAAPNLLTLADYLKLFADKPLLFPPGKGKRYSNSGYVVLGLIIEKVSGQSYHDYVREHVFAPAGMGSSGPSERGLAAAGRAIGYTRETPGPEPPKPGSPNPLHPNTDSMPGRSSSAGGGLSTVRDLLAFDRALASGKLLPPKWTAWMYSGKSGPPAESDAVPSEKGGGLGVAGGTEGVNAVLESDNAAGYTIIVLANLDPPIAERTASKLRRWMQRLGSLGSRRPA